MNNIYKVIWSKAKNCYVVASEIARSHTKSATGSEKIGGVTRRSLLASLMALSLLCGGLGVASAVDVVHVDESASGGIAGVYTTTKVDALLNGKADETAVEEIKNTVGNVDSGLVKKTNDNATAIEVNRTNINTLKDTVGDDTKGLTKKINDNTAAIANKAETAAVTALEGRVGDLETAVGDASHGLVKDVNELKNQGIALNNALGTKVDQSDLDAANAKITANEGNIAALKTKTTNLSDDGKALNGMTTVETDALKVTGGISNGAGVTTTLTDINNSMTQTATNKDDITTLKTKTDGQQTAINGLDKKTTKITYDAALGTNVDGVTFNAGKVTGVTSINGIDIGDAQVDMKGKNLTGVGTINGTEIGTKVGGNYIHQDSSIWGNMNSVDTQVKTNADNIKTNTTAITTLDTKVGKIDDRTGGITRNPEKTQTTIEGAVKVDNQGNVKDVKGLSAETITTGALNVTGASDLKGDVSLGTPNGANTVTVNGIADFNEAVNMDNGLTVDKGLNVTSGESNLKNTTVDGTLSVNKETTLNGKLTANDEATFTKKVTMENDLEVKGELKTDKIAMENKKTDADGTIHNSSTTITADGITHNGEVKKSGVTTESQFTHTEEGSETYAKKGDATDWTETRSDVKADGVNTEVKDSKGNRTNTSQTTEVINGFAIDEDGNSSTTSQTAKDINGNVTDKDGNKTDMKVTATENSIQIQDKDGKNTNHQVNTMGSSVTEIKNGDGKTTRTEQTATDITNTAEQGTIKNNAMNIENNASGNITNNAQNGTITNNAKDIVNNATGDMTNTVGGKLTTTVTDKATEDFKGGLDTNVTGKENHTVTGDQNIHVTGKQTNEIGGDQENTIGGNQTTTVEGNVKEDYKKDLTTTVGGNELHEVTGTKTENVTGKVTENYQAGQATNVTGDQDITVSGTQTTTATDINRNASSSMVDKVDNAYGTNTETKEAGKTTTDVSIKGTGEKGQYIRGANESRDYLIKGTLMNSETKTAEATSTEITDGTNKASTRQDAKNLAGSVTNGTEIGVSGIHANDDGSVSIDSAVAGGGMSSVINQKKDSIQSAVGDGTNSTVIHQDKDNVTIASSNGTVAIVGKDIVNNASESITNKAKTMDTTVTGKATESYGELDTTVNGMEKHTVNGNQDIHVTGKQTNTVEGGQENIISGGQTNTITGGQINNITGDQTTTITGNKTETVTENVTEDYKKNLTTTVGGDEIHEVKGTKTETVEGKVTEKFNNGQETTVTGDQDIHVTKNQTNEIGGNQVNTIGGNQTTTVTGDISNTAKNITNEATDTLTDKVGDNTRVINGEGITDTVGGSNLKSRVTQKKGSIETVVTDGTSFNHSRDIPVASTKTLTGYGKMNQLLDDLNSSTKTITDGTHKTSKVQTALDITNTAADGTITNAAKDIVNNAQDTITNTAGTKITDTAGDSTVTTENGKGTTFTKRGSMAYRDGGPTDTNISGNTITTGKVTMDYAEVMRDLGVGGNANIAGTTTTKTLNVTEDASVGRDLSVGGNATITGDVTANSYKVGRNTYIDANGINANNQKITNVADGSISEGSKDAVNGGQLYGVKRDLEHQVDKVGANAAAMANLRPMEFDPSSKWNIAAAIGNYGSETAAAIGAFYRPNDNVMVNLSTAFGTGENMVGGGVSVRLGKGGNKLSREETNALKAQVADLTARMDALLSVLNPNMSKDFPDVPENHWAYEAVSRLAGNDIVQGYPDGEFHGERTMTRYEMAEIIYNALSRGAEAERKLVEEFKPELQAMAASEKSTAEKAEG